MQNLDKVLGETPEKYSFSGVLLYLGH